MSKEFKTIGGSKEIVLSEDEMVEHEEFKKIKKAKIEKPDDITDKQIKRIVYQLAKQAGII